MEKAYEGSATRLGETIGMTHLWTECRERGSGWLTAFAVRLILRFGRNFGRLLMYPISLYFFIFSRGTAKHSQAYLKRAIQRPLTILDRFRHYYFFAMNITDRPFFLMNRFEYYDISIKGREYVERYIDTGTGCILLGTHLGSFEVLRAVGTFKKGIPIKALYHEHNSSRFDAILNELNPAATEQLIRMGQPDTMLRVREFVASGGLVGILGDRANKGSKVKAVEFLGSPAALPIWPYRLSAAIGCPIILFFGLYHGGNRYEIVFEPFAEKVEASDIANEDQLSRLVEAYAERIEFHCRRAPFNWFNFFDYWQPPAAADGLLLARR